MITPFLAVSTKYQLVGSLKTAQNSVKVKQDHILTLALSETEFPAM